MIKVVEAAKVIDWDRVAFHQPPCFHLESNGQFCGRHQHWPGHSEPERHAFVALHELLSQMADAITASSELLREVRTGEDFETVCWEQAEKNEKLLGIESE